MTSADIDSAARLDRELESLREVERSLRDERQALEEQDVARLETAVAAKKTAIARHGDLRQSAPAAASHPASAQQPALRERLDTLRTLGETCDRLNRENGSLITRMQERTRRALEILRRSERSPQLYSGTGATEQSGGRHSLGKA